MSLSYSAMIAELQLGRLRGKLFDVTWDSSYPTGGEVLSPAVIGIANLTGAYPVGGADATSNGIVLAFVPGASPKLMAMRTAGFTPAGTVAAPIFTGTAPTASLNLATPVFSGTGYATSGQVITTSDNQTMTLNQCAGMWFIPPSGAKPGVIILSNTAVAGAPAVLTVQGIAPTTDAGAYKIVTSLAPVGTNSAPAFSGTPVAISALVEVANGVSLAAVTSRILFIGN